MTGPQQLPIPDPLTVEIAGGDGFDWITWISTVAPSVMIALLVVWLGHRFTVSQAERHWTEQTEHEARRWEAEHKRSAYVDVQRCAFQYQAAVNHLGRDLKSNPGEGMSEKRWAAVRAWGDAYERMQGMLGVAAIFASPDYLRQAQRYIDSVDPVKLQQLIASGARLNDLSDHIAQASAHLTTELEALSLIARWEVATL